MQVQSTFYTFRSCFLQRTGQAFLAFLATCMISAIISTSINIFTTLFIAWVIQCRASQVRTSSAVFTDGDLGHGQDIHLVWLVSFENQCETFKNIHRTMFSLVFCLFVNCENRRPCHTLQTPIHGYYSLIWDTRKNVNGLRIV